MHRIRALADALRAGVLYPRWFPDFTFDYGYPVLNYYPPLFYYPSALLRLVGLEMVLSLRLPISVGFAFSAWWMYRFAREFFSVWPAVVCVICYQFHPYRMLDLLERGAFPEFVAFMWLPLVALYGIRAAAARPRIERRTESRAEYCCTGTGLVSQIPSLGRTCFCRPHSYALLDSSHVSNCHGNRACNVCPA